MKKWISCSANDLLNQLSQPDCIEGRISFLVVVEVDKNIFEGNNIEEIFIQVPNVDYGEIKDKLQNLVGKEIKIQHYSNLHDFYLPIHTNPTERIFNSKSLWIDN